MAAAILSRVDQSHNIDKLVRVGPYELLKTIGKGNFAVVKLAVHTITKTQVWLKPNLFQLSVHSRQGHESSSFEYSVTTELCFVFILGGHKDCGQNKT